MRGRRNIDREYTRRKNENKTRLEWSSCYSKQDEDDEMTAQSSSQS